METNSKFEFRILSIEVLSSYIKSISTLKISDWSKDKITYSIGMKLDFHQELGVLDIFINCDFVFKDGETRIPLFGLQSVTKYQFRYFKDIIFNNKDKTITAPHDLMLNLGSLAYSTTRGLMVSLTARSDYEDIILPIKGP